ncbi:MAG: hypothetical protein OZ928_15995 [Polyangiaceae bacterium]|nr:hypothetical protein [Polyangiaceae bacterium]
MKNSISSLAVGAGLLALFVNTGCGTAPCEGDECTAYADEVSDAAVSQPLSTPVCLASAAGKYCGNGGYVQNGLNGVLYACQGANKAPTAQTACSAECVVAPAGKNDFCGSTMKATAGNLYTLRIAGWNSAGYGAYDGVVPGVYGPFGPLSALAVPSGYVKTSSLLGTFKAARIYDPGNPYSPHGQCVDFAKAVSGRTSATSTWVKSAPALSAATEGVVVATFDSSGNYSGHVGVYAGYSNGMILYDANWSLDGLVKKHTLVTTGTGLADPTRYFIVKAP